MSKDFKHDFISMLNRLKENKPFSLSRYGDGEFSIIIGQPINILNKANGEFKYVPNSDDEKYRENLIKSFKYQHKNYYVGIGCPCCIGVDNFNRMRDESEQPEDQLTWANIFVNNNYLNFQENFIPELGNHKTVLIANKKAKLDKLPFKPAKQFFVGSNAWKDDYTLIERIKNYIHQEKIRNYVFLIAAGPLANILVYQLHMFEKNNIYLDIGSTLDPYLGLGRHRGYLRGANTLKKVCIWK